MSERFIRRGGSCLLEILVASVLVALGFLAMYRAWLNVRTRTQSAHTQAALSSLSAAIALYRSDWSMVPTGTNADLVRALTTTTRRGGYFSITCLRINAGGELLDGWGNPYIYVSISERDRVTARLYSCGPNGKDDSGAGDDLNAP